MRMSRTIASFFTFSSSKIEDVSHNSFVFKLAERQIDRQTNRQTEREREKERDREIEK